MTERKSEDIVSAKIFGDIPEIQPGQILVAPVTNRLYDQRIDPIDNFLHFPDWFKKLNAEEQHLKRCQGTQDFLNTGMTLRLPCDVRIRKNAFSTGWEARYDTQEEIQGLGVESFGYEQTGPIPATNGRAVETGNWIKILNPWEIKTAPGWSSMILPVLWEQDRRWNLVPGVVHTDFYHHMNWVLNIFTDEDEFVIPMGTKIAHIITFPRTVDYKVIYGDQNVHELIFPRGMGEVFVGYDENRKRKYRMQQRKQDEVCPVFHGSQPAKKRFRDRLFRLFRTP